MAVRKLVCSVVDRLVYKGVKGASILMAHKHFNLSKGAVIDIMHCLSWSNCKDPDGFVVRLCSF